MAVQKFSTLNEAKAYVKSYSEIEYLIIIASSIGCDKTMYFVEDENCIIRNGEKNCGEYEFGKKL